MRLSVSDSAVSIRIGTCLSARSDLVSSTPFSPGIITSSTSRSKSRPSSLRRASSAVPATVTRKPFSVRYCVQQVADAGVVVDDQKMRRVVARRCRTVL